MTLNELFFERKEYNDLLDNNKIVFLILVQIIQPLLLLRKHNICHRDLKFQNILINKSDFQIKLIDFNAAKLIKGNETDNTIIDSGIFVNFCNLNTMERTPIDNVDTIYYQDISSLGYIIYCLCKREIRTTKFCKISHGLEKNLMFSDILQEIFQSEKQSLRINRIDELVRSQWYVSNHILINDEIKEIREDYSNKHKKYLIDPYSVLLKKKIEERLNTNSSEFGLFDY